MSDKKDNEEEPSPSESLSGGGTISEDQVIRPEKAKRGGRHVMPAGGLTLGGTMADMGTLSGGDFDGPPGAGPGGPPGAGLSLAGMTLPDGTILSEDVDKQWSATLSGGYTAQHSLKWMERPDEEEKQKDSTSQIASRVNIGKRAFDNTIDSDTTKHIGKRKLGDTTEVDYRLLDLIGEGGMGYVMNATQTCMDRSVAIKMVKDEGRRRSLIRDKFLAEAAATGNLDHPNIVAVHEFGQTEEGHLFYAMKHVRGSPWNEVIKEKDMEENLQIFEAVCNAIAFAHDQGVIHRDLKPENVMIGGYGEVLVMDWGLAASYNDTGKADRIQDATDVCGTPIYMPPEMAIGDGSNIGPNSDIYLLGAILFEILNGYGPHTGRNIKECLLNAAKNVIRDPLFKGELLDIALKAMATRPEDRYRAVQEMQTDIKSAISHSESVDLATRAQQELEKAGKTGEYSMFAQAIYGFQEAINLWGGNDTAQKGLIQTKLDYAGTALEHGDLDLAESIVVKDNDAFTEVSAKIQEARDLRAQQEKQRQRGRKIVRIGAAAFVVFLIVFIAWIVHERNKAVKAQEEAILEKEKAQKQEKKATQALLALRAAEAREGKLRSQLWRQTPEEAKTLQRMVASEKGWPIERTLTVGEAGAELKLALIPPGRFTMGSHPNEIGREPIETLHDVELTTPFYMAVYETTQAQWKALVPGPPPSATARNGSPRHPVESVSHDDVTEKFLAAIQKYAPAGFAFDLPTEAEWEYACRAGSITAFHAGDDPEGLKEYDWTKANSGKKVHYTGGKKPNTWGLFDMHGNVAEWCKDSYSEDYYLQVAEEAMKSVEDPEEVGPAVDPVNTAETPLRVYRGGTFYLKPEDSRSGYRAFAKRATKHRMIGFRVILRPLPTPQP